MALIDCPECGREVSSSASVCPDCAYQLGPAPGGPRPVR
jgi:NMD protein affecting ribosome stability and mRNA decay